MSDDHTDILAAIIDHLVYDSNQIHDVAKYARTVTERDLLHAHADGLDDAIKVIRSRMPR